MKDQAHAAQPMAEPQSGNLDAFDQELGRLDMALDALTARVSALIPMHDQIEGATPGLAPDNALRGRIMRLAESITRLDRLTAEIDL